MKNRWNIFDNWEYRQSEKLPDFDNSVSTGKKSSSDKGNQIGKSPILDWSVFDTLSSSLSSIFVKKIKTLENLTTQWNEALNHYGGDPSNYNWINFRPLRLSREEDWSDWLIYLISESKTGYFSNHLLQIQGFDKDCFSMPLRSEREIAFSGHRADIVIQWKNKSYTHIEVKIGDASLSKTYGTAKKMREYYKAAENTWYDFILLLDNQVYDWQSINHENRHPVQYITWSNVGISLRKSLVYSSENITWKVWAYSFLGSIEQRLLNLKKEYKTSDILAIDTTVNILQEGLNNGK